MRILRLHVENFGKLQNVDLMPSKGLTVLHHENGWGKTTLAVFIKAMLYGLPATSKRSLDENERKKYTPWQGGAFGGSIEFETEKGRFRAERFFGAKEANDTFALYNLATNKPSNAYSAALGEELFGIDADGFERSTYLSQRSLVGSKDNNSISAKLGNLLDDVGDIGNYDVALAALDKRRSYYVKSGNRGAIAELEQERLSRQAELERCLRVDEAMREQEDQLDTLTTELLAVQKTSEETRARLAQAGLARERAALLEQKNKMLSELSALSTRRTQAEEFFRGIIPSAAELAESERLYEGINNLRIKLENIPSEPHESELLDRLRHIFANGVPSDRYLEQLEQENDELRRAVARLEALKNVKDSDPNNERFASGTPSQEQLDHAFETISQAQKLQKKIDETAHATIPQKSGNLLPLSCCLLIPGIVAVLLGFLPALAALATLCFALGGLLTVGGAVLLGLAIAGKKRQQRAANDAQEQIRAWQAQRAQAVAGVKAFLNGYRMPTDDMHRSLTELSVLASQYNENKQQQRRLREEMNALASRREELTARILGRLSPFFDKLSKKEDFRAELDRLQKAVTRYRELEETESRRINDREQTEAALDELKNQLLPFLRRYDPSGRMRARECLETISARLAEQRRLAAEFSRKERELKAFIAEKKLDEQTDLADVEELDRLSEEEKELQARLGELHTQRATLKSAINRLAVDADRIPELEAEIAHLTTRIVEAKANAETVKNTAKFLEEAKNALSTRYLGGMQTSLQSFLNDLAGGEAPESLMDTSFEVRLREGGQTRTMESFSRGWRDAVEFCVRLSLTNALYEDSEKPFLLLDDPFVNLDDTRLAAARRLLEKLSKEYQILYLVCHSKRK